MPTTRNAIRVIAPYWSHGTWVFDDPSVGLVREPFVAGIPAMIDALAAEVPNAREGFRLTFSDAPFPGYQRRLAWVRDEHGGCHYRFDDRPDAPAMEGWLCPALFHYFDAAPKAIYARADPLG